MGTCYVQVTLVTEVDGKDKLTMYALRYQDKYVKINGRNCHARLSSATGAGALSK